MKTRAVLAATPNPVPPTENSVAINWDTGDGSQGQVRVSVNGSEETVFAGGAAGSEVATWIGIGETCDFRLYDAASGLLVANLVVRREELPWETVAEGLRRFAAQASYDGKLAALLADVAGKFAHPPLYTEYFRLWEEHGFHLTPVHFYQPIPDTGSLEPNVWESESELPGIDLNVERQLSFLRDVFPRFRDEYDAFSHAPTEVPHEFHFDNDLFSGTDALVLYCMLRHFRPKLVIEIGSGFSTRVAALAATRNGDTELVSVEPYPDAVLDAGFPGLDSLLVRPVQELDVEFFDRLRSGDVLFIDTSHVVRTGGDVNYLFLEILPRLRTGVIVHVHDVFLPRDYPRDWLLRERRFWSEQYLLHAFLACNDRFEVLLANSYLGQKHPSELRRCFPRSPWWDGVSFWMRRKDA